MSSRFILCRTSVSEASLAYGEFGELAFEGGVEAEDDVVFGDALFDEFEGDAAFSPIVLNPDFAVFDVEVKDAAVDTTFVGPADMDNLVMVALGVEDCLGLQVWVVEVNAAVVFQEYLDKLAVVVYVCHFTIISSSGS